MRLRVLGILSVLSILIVLAVSASILASASTELTQELQINRVAALNRFAQVAGDATSSGDLVQLQREMDRYSALYGEGVLVHTPQTTLASGGLRADEADVRNAVAQAQLNLNDLTLERVQPFGPKNEVIARSFGTASQVLGEAVIDVDLTAAEQKLRDRWLLVALGALAVWVLLILGAERLTRWVLRPVHRLTDAVIAFEESERATRLREEGPPELQRLSRAFSAMAEHVGASIKAQRQLIADTSHQLRNPVGALRLRTDLLALELDTPAQREAASGVVKELDQVEEMLDRMLRLAAAEHRARRRSFAVGSEAPVGELSEVLDPSMVLQEAIERAGPSARHAGAVLELDNPPMPRLQLACGRGDLADIVGELLENAIKYAGPEGGRITLRAALRGRSAVVEVADRGPGLSPEEREAATTRFWRSPGHSASRGTGLGLPIVEQLAEVNGGRLVLAPNEPRGLIARVEFPLACATADDDALPGGGVDIASEGAAASDGENRDA
ncbi:MAG TPA: HAMP domain-containing sensor histidine kinase [Sinomonas sp.]|nr:HAMP domain-containing sensor histidine kinase [Sinomonas sp.]